MPYHRHGNVSGDVAVFLMSNIHVSVPYIINYYFHNFQQKIKGNMIWMMTMTELKT